MCSFESVTVAILSLLGELRQLALVTGTIHEVRDRTSERDDTHGDQSNPHTEGYNAQISWTNGLLKNREERKLGDLWGRVLLDRINLNTRIAERAGQPVDADILSFSGSTERYVPPWPIPPVSQGAALSPLGPLSGVRRTTECLRLRVVRLFRHLRTYKKHSESASA